MCILNLSGYRSSYYFKWSSCLLLTENSFQIISCQPHLLWIGFLWYGIWGHSPELSDLWVMWKLWPVYSFHQMDTSWHLLLRIGLLDYGFPVCEYSITEVYWLYFMILQYQYRRNFRSVDYCPLSKHQVDLRDNGSLGQLEARFFILLGFSAVL